MTLYNKIRQIYPELNDEDFYPYIGTILLRTDDGKETYIKEWNHPTLTQPTQEDLDALDS